MDKNFPELVNFEYETQLFGCSSKDVKEGLENVLNCKIRESVAELVNTLKQVYKDASTETVSCIEKEIVNSYKVASEEPMKILEEDIKKYFEIPSYVLLPEDQPQQIQYNKEDMKEIDEEISNLLKRVEVVKYKSAALKEQYDDLNQVLDECTTKTAELEKIMKENDTTQQNLFNSLKSGQFLKNDDNRTS